MKNKALINEQGVVVNIAVFSDDSVEEKNWIEYLEGNPAFIGGDYVDGFFYIPQPFASWSRDGFGSWQAPIPKPQDGKEYIWNDNKGEWEEVVE
jgi:hypothetical protein